MLANSLFVESYLPDLIDSSTDAFHFTAWETLFTLEELAVLDESAEQQVVQGAIIIFFR